MTLPLRGPSTSLSFSYRSRGSGSNSPALAAQPSPGIGRASSASPVLQLDNSAAAAAGDGRSSAVAQWQPAGHWHSASPSDISAQTAARIAEQPPSSSPSSASDGSFESHTAPLRELLTHSYADAGAPLSTPARVILSTRCDCSVLVLEATDLQRCWRLAVDEAAFRAQLQRLTLPPQAEQQLCSLIAAALRGNARDAPLVSHSLSPLQPADAQHAAASSPLLPAPPSSSALRVNIALLVQGALTCLSWTLPAASGGEAADEQKALRPVSTAGLPGQSEASGSSSGVLVPQPSALESALERLVQCGLTFADVAGSDLAQLTRDFQQLCLQLDGAAAALLGGHSGLLLARLTALDAQMASCPPSPQPYHDALHCLSAVLSITARDVQRVYPDDAVCSSLDALTRRRLSPGLASADTETALRSDALFAYCLLSRLQPAQCTPHFSLLRFLHAAQQAVAPPLSRTARAPLPLSEWLLQLHVVAGLGLLLILTSHVERVSAALPDLLLTGVALLYVLLVTLVCLQSLLRTRSQSARDWAERRSLCRFALLCLMLRLLGTDSADYVSELYCQQRPGKRKKATRAATTSQAASAEARDDASAAVAEPVQPPPASRPVNGSSSGSGADGSRVGTASAAAGKRARSKKRRVQRALQQPLLASAPEAAINRV